MKIEQIKTNRRIRMLLMSGISMAGCIAGAAAATQKSASAPEPNRVVSSTRGLLTPGFLSTSGNQIVDSTGRPQRLACVGYNEPGKDIVGDVAGMKKAGFNCLRYPFDEAALSSTFPEMDAIVAAATPLGIKVIFDHHVDDSKELCGGQQQNGLWFDSGEGSNDTDGCGNKGTVTRAQFKADWVMVAKHYAGNSTVIAFDLDNEPLVLGKNSTPITWGGGGPTDIMTMFEEVGSAIEAADPGVLIVGECPINYSGKLLNGEPEGTKGIMDCSAAASHPVILTPAAPKFVYSIHDYPNIGTNNEGPTTADRNTAFGFLEMQNTAPVWIGEMGASMDEAMDFGDKITVEQQAAWAKSLVDYSNGRDPNGPKFTATQQPFGTDWWAWGDLSGQTPDGTLKGTALRPEQLAIYSQLRFGSR